MYIPPKPAALVGDEWIPRPFYFYLPANTGVSATASRDCELQTATASTNEDTVSQGGKEAFDG